MVYIPFVQLFKRKFTIFFLVMKILWLKILNVNGNFAKTQFFYAFWRIVLLIFRQNSNFFMRFGELFVCSDNK